MQCGETIEIGGEQAISVAVACGGLGDPEDFLAGRDHVIRVCCLDQRKYGASEFPKSLARRRQAIHGEGGPQRPGGMGRRAVGQMRLITGRPAGAGQILRDRGAGPGDKDGCPAQAGVSASRARSGQWHGVMRRSLLRDASWCSAWSVERVC